LAAFTRARLFGKKLLKKLSEDNIGDFRASRLLVDSERDPPELDNEIDGFSSHFSLLKFGFTQKLFSRSGDNVKNSLTSPSIVLGC
jgi:hypothetical protein